MPPEHEDHRDRDDADRNDRPPTHVLRSIVKMQEQIDFTLGRILDRLERIENRQTSIERTLSTWASPEAIAKAIAESGIKPAIEGLAEAAAQPKTLS